MSAKVKKALRELQSAECPEDIFGELVGDQQDALKKSYRDWAKRTHSDLCSDADKPLAEEAFKLLTALLAEAEKRVKGGTYGKRNAISATVTLTSKNGVYTVGSIIASGDISDVLSGKFKDVDVVAKVTRSPANNVLLKNEGSVLKHFWSDAPAAKLKAMQHVPKLIDSFEVKDGKAIKQVNVFNRLEGFYTIQQVTEAYPALDPRDAAWMINRILASLLVAHQNGYVHGALLPCHWMIRPEDQHGILIDWSYAVKKGEKITAICPKYKEFYPKDVFDKKPANFGYDLYTLAVSVIALLGGDTKTKQFPKSTPSALAGLFKACLLNYNQREQDIGVFYDDFNKVLEGLYGRKKFREFKMPPNV